MDKKQLKDLIEKSLLAIGLHSEDAVSLILGTIAQESRVGTYIKQLGNGPALGVCQIEPNTFNDHIENFLKYRPELEKKIKWFCGIDKFKVTYLEWNLALSICMCRVHYLRVSAPLPSNMKGWAAYWKKYYNTYLGAGTEIEFIHNYKKYVL